MFAQVLVDLDESLQPFAAPVEGGVRSNGGILAIECVYATNRAGPPHHTHALS
jgi:hypothetical protein